MQRRTSTKMSIFLFSLLQLLTPPNRSQFGQSGHQPDEDRGSDDHLRGPQFRRGWSSLGLLHHQKTQKDARSPSIPPNSRQPAIQSRPQRKVSQMIVRNRRAYRVLGHSLVRSLVRSHRSLIRWLRTARFARALRCAHSFARSLTHSLPSSWERGF